jgi:hypothetical protein
MERRHRRGNPTQKKMKPSASLGRREGGTHVGYSKKSLEEGAM